MLFHPFQKNSADSNHPDHNGAASGLGKGEWELDPGQGKVEPGLDLAGVHVMIVYSFASSSCRDFLSQWSELLHHLADPPPKLLSGTDGEVVVANGDCNILAP